MKFFIILAIFLAISVQVIVSQGEEGAATDESQDNPTDAGDSSENGGEGENVENGQTGGGEETKESTDDTAGGDESESTNNSTDTETGETDNGGNNSTETDGDTKTNAMKVYELINTLTAKCRSRYTACYGPDSDEDDIKDTVIADEDDDDICELIEDGEDCVTEEMSGNVCTDDEYEDVRKLACSANRSAILSVVLLGVLSLISKILSQH